LRTWIGCCDQTLFTGRLRGKPWPPIRVEGFRMSVIGAMKLLSDMPLSLDRSLVPDQQDFFAVTLR
jgi:hypothetical protein